MHRRLLSITASFALVASFLLGSAGGVLAAGPIGACGSGNATYQSGESAVAIRDGISASILVPGSTFFGPCTPDDNSGINAASANINIHYGSAFLETGLIRCNTTNNSAWPAGLCDGRLHFFLEQHGQFSWDYNMWDEGIASTGVAYTFTIQYFRSDSTYHASVGALSFGHVDMGSGLVPAQSNGYDWQVETKDVGDGLGTVASATNVGQMKTLVTNSSTWSFHPVGTACDVISSQHHCVANGSYAYYAYTAN